MEGIPAVEMNEVGRRFGASWILAHLNLKVERGESIALFGNNGSGKSTLLQMIATLLAPSTGRLRVLGNDAAEQRGEIRNRIRFLTHQKQLYPILTVFENMRLAAALRGLPAREGAVRIHALLERLRLREAAARRVSELSEGMKKRLVLARLMIGEADLILLDEPHPTLDSQGKEVLNELIREWRRGGKTVLLASHDHEQALRHADRLLVLEGGSFSYDGPPR